MGAESSTMACSEQRWPRVPFLNTYEDQNWLIAGSFAGGRLGVLLHFPRSKLRARSRGEGVTGNRERIRRHMGDLRNSRTTLVRRMQSAIRVHAIHIVQPPGTGIEPIADIDAYQAIVIVAL